MVPRGANWVWVLLVLVASALVYCRPSAAFAAPSTGSLERWGFYISYDPASQTSLRQHLSQLDVVVPNYFSLEPDGAIASRVDDSVDATISGAGKQLWPLVQSRVSGSALSPFLEQPQRRSDLVNAIVGAAAEHQFAGVTLDFEGIDPADGPAFAELIQDLAASLHARGMRLAVAVPATDGKTSTAWTSGYDDAAIATSADRLIVMAYAYRTQNSPNPGSISPLTWVANVASFAVDQVPPDHLIFGIGLWGYDWNLSGHSPAVTLRYDQTAALMANTGGHLRYDSVDGSAVYQYQAANQNHQVWFENATSVQTKIAVAASQGFAGVALWRLGQEDPAIWTQPAIGGGQDFAVPGGWFFAETGGGGGLGYTVVDDGMRFWSEFKRLGGVATLGYPVSQRYVGSDGFTYQAFQRGVLQWRPEIGQAYLANIYDQLTAAGQDATLQEQGIPLPVADDGSQGDWARARDIRLSWLTNPQIARAYQANPNPAAIRGWNVSQSIQLYGLPASPPVRSGPFIVQRFQRMSLQLWVDDVPGMPAPGSVVGILGGELLKQAGVIPADAVVPQLAD